MLHAKKECAAYQTIDAFMRMGISTAEKIQIAIEWLLKIINNPHCVDAVFHPLGCLYVEIFRDEKFSLRIHVWERHKFSVHDSFSVHSHDFNMVSTILTGGIVNHVYEPSSYGEKVCRIFSIKYQGDLNILLPTNSFLRLSEKQVSQFLPGDTYTLPAQNFHKIEYMNHLTSTLVITEQSLGASTVVLGPQKISSAVVTQRVVCDKQILVSQVGRLLKILNNRIIR